MVNDKRRLEWIDIFKGILIISMVIGHSTGRFNAYIYQFHMAAFLFISGYCSVFEKRDLLQTIYNKIRSLLIPFFTVFAGFTIIVIIIKSFGFYDYIFDMPYVGAKETVMEFLSNGTNHIIWLGATWFIIVLFEIHIFYKLLNICCKNTNVNMAVSFSLFILGYLMLKNGNEFKIGFFFTDIALIAQFYFYVGYYVKEQKIFERLKVNTPTLLLCGLISVVFLNYFKSLSITVDYLSRNFGFFITDILAALNGTFFVYIISRLICEISAFKIRKAFAYVGQRTLPIMFFHFFYIKLGLCILYCFKIIPLDYLKNFLPTKEIQSVYWSFIAIVSIFCSIITWNFLCRFKVCKILFFEVTDEIPSSIYIKVLECVKRIAQKIRNFVKAKNLSVIHLYFAIIAVLTFKILLKTGIILNDELQARLFRMLGKLDILEHFIQGELRMGRPLRIMAAMNSCLSFITTNMYYNRAFQIVLIIISIVSFYYLLAMITKDKKFSAFSALLIIVFLPLVFEHSVPNAFVGLTVMPCIYLFISLILFVKYFELKNKIYYIISMLLFLLCLLSYEFMITFVLLYIVLSCCYLKWDIGKAIKSSIIPVSVAFIYIILTLALKQQFGSTYSGAQIGFVSFKSSFDIIMMLFFAAFPGYYMFNPRYNFLFEIYNRDFVTSGDIIRTLIIAIISFCIISRVCAKKNATKTNRYILLAVVGFCYSFIPSLPNAITVMYQGNVNHGSFAGLPVSYFIYFSIVLTISCVCWIIIHANKKAGAIVMVCLVLYCMPIQLYNACFSNVHASNYNRLQSIEDIFNTQTVKALNGKTVGSVDLFITKNLLAIHGGYWSQFANSVKGINVHIDNTLDEGKDAYIYYPDDEYFMIMVDGIMTILSKTPLGEEQISKLSEIQLDALVVDFKNPVMDCGYYKYSTTVELYPDNRIGSDSDTMLKVNGFYSDGWTAQTATFKISSGEEGKLFIRGVFADINLPNKLSLSINDKLETIEITSKEVDLEFDCPENQLITVLMQWESAISPAEAGVGADVRKLSLLVSEIYCT